MVLVLYSCFAYVCAGGRAVQASRRCFGDIPNVASVGDAGTSCRLLGFGLGLSSGKTLTT